MATTPDNEQAGFETDVNEQPQDQGGGSPESLEEDLPEDAEVEQLEEAQEDAAEERKEGGYQ